MNERTRQILKHPGYVGNKYDMLRREGYMRKPHLWQINFTKVPKTEVTCTYCFGARKQYNDMNGMFIESKCSICNGTGKMEIDNREARA